MMNKRIISGLLSLLLCFSLIISVSAEPKAIDFIVDEFGYLTDAEITGLNALACEIYEKTGTGIFFVFAQTDSVSDYDVDQITNGITDYVIMLENETHWILYVGGAGTAINSDAEANLRAVYDETATYAEGVQAFLTTAAAYFPEIPAATEDYTYDVNERFLYDEADLLSNDLEAALVQKLEEISHTYNAQLIVATVPSLKNENIDDYIEYLYNTMGFGYGENKDGALLLVCMEPREYRILSNGYAGIAIGPDQIDTLCDFMDTYLPNGHYSAAFNSFADQCGEFLNDYLSGYPFDFTGNLLTCLGIGLIAGLITVFVLKGQLKTVHKQHQANSYVKQGSMQIDVERDIFLYRNVTRTKKEKSSSSESSGSGSSSRSTGSGTSRSKGGGSF